MLRSKETRTKFRNFFRYGISQLRSPQRQSLNKSETSFSALQERAKLYFNDSNATENVSQMLQLLEEFCREGDKLIEEEKDAKKDLEQQVISICIGCLADPIHLTCFVCGFVTNDLYSQSKNPSQLQKFPNSNESEYSYFNLYSVLCMLHSLN